MGRKGRVKVEGLPEKLHTIRQSLGLTMEEMIRALDCPEIPLTTASITEYEKGRREPPLPILLRYAQLANILLEVLADPQLNLPP
jgi:transcriptional regulator with XRE-family HTH domain